MKTQNRVAILLAAAMASTNVMAVDEHQAAPMLAPASDVLSGWNELEEEKQGTRDREEGMDRDTVLSEFRSVYKRIGEPKIAIFWNRKFNDRLSEWETVARSSFTTDGSGNVSDVFKKQGGISAGDVSNKHEDDAANQAIGSYERNVNAKGQTLVSGYAEVKTDQSSREGMGEISDFEFGAGYAQPLLAGSAKIVDRNTIMRLVERDDSRASGSEQIADYQKVETDALVGYADYFAEIVFAEDLTTEIGMSFMVSVKEVSTGRIVAMFKSDGRVVDSSEAETRWLATSNGYEKIEIESEPATPESVGEQLAYETMQSLTKAWNY